MYSIKTPLRSRLNNKWLHAAIPALLIHCSIGTVYCWSIFSQEIANHIGFSKSNIEWAFSFAIFFLGISAAFLGRVVEKNIRLSSLISTICFTAGMLGTGAFIYWGGLHKGNFTSLIGIYIFYGFIMGIGLGTGYLSPVKTLMLWFSKQKGLATGLAVAGFGAAKAIASPIMQYMLDHLGDGSIYKMFFILSLAYFIFMFSGALLLKKPSDWHESTEHRNISNIISVIKTKPIKNYIAIWIMFYLNITCGLALLSQEKFIVQSIGLTSAAAIVSTFSAIFNAGGRLFFSAIADYMKDRNTVYKLIFALSALFTLLVTISGGIPNGIHSPLSSALTIILIMAINAGYGGGFANLAPLLSDYYGMKNISTLHGITLSAWAFAGLSGNQLASWIVRIFGETVEIGSHLVNPEGYQIVLNVTLILYAIALILSCLFVKQTSKKIID